MISVLHSFQKLQEITINKEFVQNLKSQTKLSKSYPK